MDNQIFKEELLKRIKSLNPNEVMEDGYFQTLLNSCEVNVVESFNHVYRVGPDVFVKILKELDIPKSRVVEAFFFLEEKIRKSETKSTSTVFMDYRVTSPECLIPLNLRKTEEGELVYSFEGEDFLWTKEPLTLSDLNDIFYLADTHIQADNDKVNKIQKITDEANEYLSLIDQTDFGDGNIKTVHEAIVQRLLCEAEELGLNINHEPFASLGNRQFTFSRVPEDGHLIPWHNHVFNICQVEDKLQGSNAKSVAMTLNGLDYRIDVDSERGTRAYYLNGQHIFDCTGTPTLQDFKDFFSEERRKYYKDLEKELNQ